MRLADGTIGGGCVEVMAADMELTRRQVRRMRDRAVVLMSRRNRDPKEIAWFFNIHLATVYRILDRVPESVVERDDELFHMV
jgi:hypothetical protein